jgi:hypothetical protein
MRTEALALLAAYEAKGILGQRFRNDMPHIALARQTAPRSLTSSA